MPKVVGHVRFSSAKQAAGDSYVRQTRAAKAFADEHRLELADAKLCKKLTVANSEAGRRATPLLKSAKDRNVQAYRARRPLNTAPKVHR
jgi:hypothetical protein